jgi:large subunit ribosomal protein L5
MATLKERYNKEIKAKLKDELQLKHAMQVPAIKKVTVNTGLNAKRDAKFIEVLTQTLERITGQKPVVTKARLSIAGFKIREGMPVGAMATLRGRRMWDFMEKLVNVTFPRVRDFRGIDKSTVDRDGNLNVGFKEHIAFPEVPADAVDVLHGLQVNITTTATNREEGLKLFEALGFPFKKES